MSSWHLDIWRLVSLGGASSTRMQQQGYSAKGHGSRCPIQKSRNKFISTPGGRINFLWRKGTFKTKTEYHREAKTCGWAGNQQGVESNANNSPILSHRNFYFLSVLHSKVISGLALRHKNSFQPRWTSSLTQPTKSAVLRENTGLRSICF